MEHDSLSLEKITTTGSFIQIHLCIAHHGTKVWHITEILKEASMTNEEAIALDEEQHKHAEQIALAGEDFKLKVPKFELKIGDILMWINDKVAHMECLHIKCSAKKMNLLCKLLTCAAKDEKLDEDRTHAPPGLQHLIKSTAVQQLIQKQNKHLEIMKMIVIHGLAKQALCTEILDGNTNVMTVVCDILMNQEWCQSIELTNDPKMHLIVTSVNCLNIRCEWCDNNFEKIWKSMASTLDAADISVVKGCKFPEHEHKPHHMTSMNSCSSVLKNKFKNPQDIKSDTSSTPNMTEYAWPTLHPKKWQVHQQHKHNRDDFPAIAPTPAPKQAKTNNDKPTTTTNAPSTAPPTSSTILINMKAIKDNIMSQIQAVMKKTIKEPVATAISCTIESVQEGIQEVIATAMAQQQQQVQTQQN